MRTASWRSASSTFVPTAIGTTGGGDGSTNGPVGSSRPPVVPIAVGTKVEDAERQLAVRTLEAYAGDRVAACEALGVDSARLDELVSTEAPSQPAVPNN